MKPVKVYTKTWCPHCNRAKGLFDTLDIPYEEINAEDPENQEKHVQLVEKYNHRTVPMIFIGDEFIGGADNLMALHKEGKLEEILKS